MLLLKEMDAQNMDFPDNHFDEVVATFVFCSVPDPVVGLHEALRVTKPGGRLHLLEHMKPEQPFLAGVMEKMDAPIHYLSGVHIARQTVANVEKTGWDIDKVQDLTAKGIFKKKSKRASRIKFPFLLSAATQPRTYYPDLARRYRLEFFPRTVLQWP